MSATSDFEKALTLYQRYLVEYKVSGNTVYKTASENAKQWLDRYIQSLSTEVNAGKQEIQSFVQNYANSDADLAAMKQDMSTIRTKGPELQMIYETERESQEAPPVDYGVYYTKGAVLGGIIVLAGVASMF